MTAAREREFTAETGTPAAARVFAKQATEALLPTAPPAQLCDDVELVVSELVTNAVRAGSPTVQVEVAHEGPRLVVRITDAATGWPEAREAGIPTRAGGGCRWSVRSAPRGASDHASGKIVWAELVIPDPS